jgi:transposase
VRPIRLRELTIPERELLKTKLAAKSLTVRKHERYRIVDEASKGRSISEIAERVGCHTDTAYKWVHRFNESGFTTFEAVTNPNGAVPIVSGEQVRNLIRIALSRPEDLGLPFTHWSVKKLKAYLLGQALLPEITDEWVRRLLHREGVSFQHTKTWKESPDPEFEVKKTASSNSTPRRQREAP